VIAEATGLAGLFGLLFLKETGLPIPVPGDLLVLGAGVAAAHGDVDPLAALITILLAGYLGGSLQFVLLRGGLRRPLLALLDRVGLRRARVEEHAERLRARGMRGVAISRATPGIRVVAIAASALAALRFGPFAGGLVIGNTAFVGLHFLLGLAVGAPALALVATFGLALTAAAVGLAVVGLVGWWLLRRRHAAATSSAEPSSAALEDTFVDWADATCPACLTLGLAGIRFEGR
jgi:membrane protein DedA with SNARE-associated domain